MNRRKFFTASGLAVAGSATNVVSGEEGDLSHPVPVERRQNLTVRCQQATEGDYPDIRLHLKLKRANPENRWQDKISRFDLVWEGQQIEVGKHFWEDLEGLVIENYSETELAKLPEDERTRLEWNRRDLFCPRMTLSQDKGTVYVEWQIPQECDGRSTIRWIISKSGTVLRNRETPFHEC